MEAKSATAEASASAHLLGNWETLMREGVQASRGGNAATARRLYLQALDIAQTLLAFQACDGSGADNRVAAFVVSHLNLADAYRDADQTPQALAHVCNAHHTLMALMRDAEASPALQQAARRHSRDTHTALLDHLALHGSHPDIEAALRAGCMPYPWPGATLH
ncbi:hypothetical protein [Hydrogenophaga sp.]|uniref:hypothetical protein n=1 Tax=Hydrogenophaga sp. TaxID=1904254 RepID=UPI0027251B22|nr:hypothetical protein [Hydrogenophaga sp.]MDO9438456.1 hypothetical protein [Hydrogenophaga sp.]